MRHRLALIWLFTVLTTAASAGSTVTVFAAASLKDAFSALGKRYEQHHPGVDVVFQFAGSQQLAAQIQQGAAADVFASADIKQMEASTGGKGAEFARNRLVVIVSKNAAKRVPSYAELDQPGLKLAVGVHDVPVGFYTERVLERLAQHLSRHWAQRVGGNIVSRETDVKSILAKVQLGEADAGIVYLTDAKAAAGSVVSRSIPDNDNSVASYRIASLSRASDAQGFVQYILSGEGRRVLASYGFLPPSKPSVPVLARRKR